MRPPSVFGRAASADKRRAQMVERQIARRGIRDARILAAFRTVPREEFVPDGMRQFAYDDSPLPIGVRLKVGAVSPAIRGASGRTLIAFQSEAVREWLFEGSEANFGAAEVAAARKRVAAIRARGYEQVDSDSVPGVIDVSFPVIDGAGVAVATVTMPFLSSYVQPVSFAQAVALLYEAARTITATMGGELPAVQLPR